MTIARDLANVASLMVSSSANVVFDDSVALAGGVANGVLYLNGSKTATSGAGLTYNGTTFAVLGPITLSNNLGFTSTIQRITGDMSNATLSNRLAFQTSVTNGNTNVTAITNGTGIVSSFRGVGAADPTNAPSISIAQVGTTESRVSAEIAGTASYTPLTFYTGGSEQLRILTTGGITSANGADAVGYKGTPLNEQSTAYTLVIGDMGKSIVHPITDNNARTYTIPANGTVAFPIGTAITFINMINTVTIAITTDTMYFAGSGATGSRTLAPYGMATAVKVSATSWIISGNGLS